MKFVLVLSILATVICANGSVVRRQFGPGGLEFNHTGLCSQAESDDCISLGDPNP
jgi:hypothetical protein